MPRRTTQEEIDQLETEIRAAECGLSEEEYVQKILEGWRPEYERSGDWPSTGKGVAELQSWALYLEVNGRLTSETLRDLQNHAWELVEEKEKSQFRKDWEKEAGRVERIATRTVKGVRVKNSL